MSHHGSNPFDGKKDKGKKLEVPKDEVDAMRMLLDTTQYRGATMHFPDGKLTPQDEGGIQFAIGSEGDKVILDFGTSVHWVGMTAQQAAELASSLLSKAKEVGRRNGQTVTLLIGK